MRGMPTDEQTTSSEQPDAVTKYLTPEALRSIFHKAPSEDRPIGKTQR